MDYVNKLLGNGFVIYENLKNQWYMRDSYNGKYNGHSNMISLIALHSGTDYKQVLRADYDETFDRWSVCLFEEYFNNSEEFKEVLKKLYEFINNRKENIKEKLSYEE